MAADYPPLNKFYIASYAANDRSYPILAIRLDPRTAGYRVPEDLSPHPDSKRYPNHVFTGAQPSSGDQVVTHVYEILPDPYVPFTRYDDDLGPIQGRRRSVKNEGQVAVLAADKRVTYEAREGSAIVYTEIEEEWSIKTDDDGNSLFPIKDRDFYDPSRGAVQERRQLFVPTGEEEGTLENINGVITQTSYEPYNEFLSVKIVQTYKVDGPQLIGRATDNDGQLVTVTTQRKGADGYIPPSPTATRTVEVNREDAESLVERIVDTPEIFTAKTFSLERPDPIPQKFRVAVPLQSEQEIVAGDAELPTLAEGEISRTEEQRNKFLKRTTATSRDQTVLPKTLLQKSTDNDRQEVTITETLQLGDTDEVATATTTISSEALGDGNYVVTKTEVPEVFGSEVFRKTREDITPQKFKAAQEDSTTEQNVAGTADPNISLGTGEFAKSEQQVNKFVKRVSTTSRTITEAKTLLEKVLTQDGQIGTRTLVLDLGDQSFIPSALLVDASVEALGDGRTVKTETTVPTVFSGRTIQKSRVDLTPEKFRAAQEDVTTEETVAGTVNPNISLGAGEFRKSEQQVTQFVKRVSTNTRSIEASTDLTEIVITNQGQVATRTLRLAPPSVSQSIQPDALLVDGSIEALGDGRTIKTEVRVGEVFDNRQVSVSKPDVIPPQFRASVPSVTTAETVPSDTLTPNPTLSPEEIEKSEERLTNFTIRRSTTVRDVSSTPVLRGQEYEQGINAVIPFTEEITVSGQRLGTDATIVDPLSDDFDLVKTLDLPNIGAKLDSIILQFPSRTNLTIPPILKSVTVEFETSNVAGSGQASGSGFGNVFSIEGNADAVSSAEISPVFITDIEEVYSNNIPAVSYVFFLPYPVSLQAILNRIGGGVQQWPVFRPRSHNIMAVGKKLTLKSDIAGASSVNLTNLSGSNSNGRGRGSDVSNKIVIAKIPPCLHQQISINKQQSASVNATSSVTINQTVGSPLNLSNPHTGSIQCGVNTVLPATSPTDIPRSGLYLVDSRVEIYQYGYARVYAEVINASVFA